MTRAMAAMPKSSIKVTLVRGTFRKVPRQAQWNFSCLVSFMATPRPLKDMRIKVLRFIIGGVRCMAYSRPRVSSRKG